VSARGRGGRKTTNGDSKAKQYASPEKRREEKVDVEKANTKVWLPAAPFASAFRQIRTPAS
jgi:hypothetical protein